MTSERAIASAPVTGPSIAAALLLRIIGAYRRWISPWLGVHCRFTPSCSAYAAEAVGLHGAARGLLLAGWRVLRCHPWHPGGADPVPARR